MKPVALEVSGLLTPRPTGVGIYGRFLLQALKRRAAMPYSLWHPLSRWRSRRHLPELDLPLHAYFAGGGMARRASLLHALDTRFPSAYKGPLVATLFDLQAALPLQSALEFSSPRFRRKKLLTYRAIARRADYIVALSAAVRREILEKLAPRGVVEVILPGVDAPEPALGPEKPQRLLEPYGIRPPYFLAVGALCPRKNLQAACAALQAGLRLRSELRLVLAGEPSYGWEGSAGEGAVRRCAHAVTLTGYLPRPVLWAAYRQAEALLYLSHYEGFGLPVLEALAAGTPVVASDGGGIPEAAGGAAWLVNPEQADEVATAVGTVLAKGPEVQARRQRGIAHARQFTWDRAAERLEQLYGDLLSS